MALSVAVLGGLGAALVPGCGVADCAATATCADGDPKAEADSGARVYPTVPPPPGCNPTADAKDAPACVADEYALFVDGVGGSNNGAGTREAPLRTLSAATDIDKLRGRPRIYVCGVGPYTDRVDLPPNVSLFGGFECKTWNYVGSKTKIAVPAGVHALRVIDSSAAALSDLDISSSDAVDPGGSSVAVLAIRSTLTIRRAVITAGQGMDAPPAGAPPSNFAPDEVDGIASTNAAGGGERACSCPQFGKSRGGRGGDAAKPGGPGWSDPVATISFGRDAAGGEGTSGSCTKGRPGSDGSSGAGGEPRFVLGALTEEGWTPARGAVGAPGSPGAGGGGGGGNGSAGGGGGGCGGCGGAGGLGAPGGGGSIALAVLTSDAILVESSLTTGAAGAGGIGGQGQGGQPGGAGGPGACAGAVGGNGGGGGGGGGGAGGVSAPVLRVGGSVVTDTATVLSPGKAGYRGLFGLGGAGGENSGGVAQGGSPGREGVDGEAQPIVVVID